MTYSRILFQWILKTVILWPLHFHLSSLILLVHLVRYIYFLLYKKIWNKSCIVKYIVNWDKFGMSCSVYLFYASVKSIIYIYCPMIELNSVSACIVLDNVIYIIYCNCTVLLMLILSSECVYVSTRYTHLLLYYLNCTDSDVQYRLISVYNV